MSMSMGTSVVEAKVLSLFVVKVRKPVVVGRSRLDHRIRSGGGGVGLACK